MGDDDDNDVLNASRFTPTFLGSRGFQWPRTQSEEEENRGNPPWNKIHIYILWVIEFFQNGIVSSWSADLVDVSLHWGRLELQDPSLRSK